MYVNVSDIYINCKIHFCRVFYFCKKYYYRIKYNIYNKNIYKTFENTNYK